MEDPSTTPGVGNEARTRVPEDILKCEVAYREYRAKFFDCSESPLPPLKEWQIIDRAALQFNQHLLSVDVDKHIAEVQQRRLIRNVPLRNLPEFDSIMRVMLNPTPAIPRDWTIKDFPKIHHQVYLKQLESQAAASLAPMQTESKLPDTFTPPAHLPGQFSSLLTGAQPSVSPKGQIARQQGFKGDGMILGAPSFVVGDLMNMDFEVPCILAKPKNKAESTSVNTHLPDLSNLSLGQGDGHQPPLTPQNLASASENVATTPYVGHTELKRLKKARYKMHVREGTDYDCINKGPRGNHLALEAGSPDC